MPPEASSDNLPRMPRPRTASNPIYAPIRRALLNWYDRHQRPLPWRRGPPDPYHIWIAEIMLQQTQVATALPYWRRFVRRFPNVRRLAESSIEDVLAHWSGLGYYHRAHHLRDAARRIVAEHRGRIPSDVDALMSLAGIGRYTAGAISSIAFGRRAAVVDGNVRRVFARLFHPVESGRDAGAFWDLAAILVPPGRPGDFNQAVMELGALVCLPTSPRCQACPLARFCAARLAGVQDRIPPARRRAPRKLLEVASLLITRRRRVLLVRRDPGGLWAGLWDVPHVPLESDARPDILAGALLRDLGFSADGIRPLEVVTRQLTHRTFRAHVFMANSPRGAGPRSDRYRWYDPRTPSAGMSRAAEQIIKLGAAQFARAAQRPRARA